MRASLIREKLKLVESKIAGVIFDLGAVVIDWNPMHLYRKVFAGDEAKAADFLKRICPPEWNEMQDAGRSLEAATAERLALFPEWESEIRAFYGRWPEMIGGPIPGTAEIMRELSALGVRLFALSNWSAETFPLVRDKFRELDLFEEIFLSGEHKIAKPDERFYRAALERIDIPAENLVFVDDSLKNVRASEKIGLRALLFTGADRLRSDLRTLGVGLIVDPA